MSASASPNQSVRVSVAVRMSGAIVAISCSLSGFVVGTSSFASRPAPRRWSQQAFRRCGYPHRPGRCRKIRGVGSREARIGKNEALFREVNERIREITHARRRRGVPLRVRRRDLHARRSAMTLGEYEGVRADPTHFLVVPGHELLDIER